jgi:general secretion pathway protein K
MNSVLPKYAGAGEGRHGSALVLVLIVVSSLTVISVGLAYRTRIEMKLAQSDARRTQAYYLALGGVERIKALISQEQELSPAVLARICQFSATAKEERLFEQIKGGHGNDSEFLTYSLRDEQGYLNVNKSDPACWENLEVISRELRAAMLDWMDPDDDTNPDGAETDFYQRLESPYVAKNKPCVTLKELLFSRAMTWAMYTGEDFNRDSFLDDNERDGLFRLPPDNEDSILQPGLVDIFTVYGGAKVNVNTAPRAVLAALPGLDAGVADIILSHRAGPDRRAGTEDDAGLAGAEEIARVEGLTEQQVELLQQYCCFGSEYFRIFSSAGLEDSFECCLLAVLVYAEGKGLILSVERLL